jgi:hypothetical protein
VKYGAGLGAAALATLLRQDTATAAPHFASRAKNVIYIHLVGAPSHLDLFDDKPELRRRTGELCPEEFFEGRQFAFIRQRPRLLGTPADNRFAFRRCGQSGLALSSLLPNLHTVADEMCLVKSMVTTQFNHAPAQLHLLTGFSRFGRPSVGSWVSYGLGSENRDLPAYVVLITGQVLGAGSSAWGSGFLPTIHQGIEFRSQGDPVLFLSNPPGVSGAERHDVQQTLRELNESQLAGVGDPEIATRIAQYELAFRMQTSVPDLMNIAGEPRRIHEMYGSQPGRPSFANNCLLARRLVERGVRFVQLFDEGWDHHGGVFESLPNKCRQVDQPIAALIRDLRDRGLLDQTLIVWAAEFGRTPMAQGIDDNGRVGRVGRDHHRDAYCLWLAGGGVKGGHVHGATDPLGYSVADSPVTVYDFNATILHLLGLDHERLTFRYQGRDFRLTDVHGRVVDEILA